MSTMHPPRHMTPGPYAAYAPGEFEDGNNWIIEDDFGRHATVYGDPPEARANATSYAALPLCHAALLACIARLGEGAEYEQAREALFESGYTEIAPI